ncbi:MAG: citramalate synthase, partial [Boseongicola sp. SB0673_bin_14]|nr:citramalate synthase [Boseongicola sp. SB0673_bin_14]
VRQIHGTLNGLGERCGNANLTTLIPTLMLKEPYASKYEIGVSKEALARLTRTSRVLDDILNRVPLRSAPYVGASAFAHKAGLHASAIAKDPKTYEHVEPASIGNVRVVPMSNQAGQSNLIKRLSEMGIRVEKGDPALLAILGEVKRREALGYAYDSAQASFELLARAALGLAAEFFEVERYRVISERRRNARGEIVVESEAVVTISTEQGQQTSYFKNEHARDLHDDGPVNALWQALKSDLGPFQSQIEDVRLTDFKVRITQGGTEAVTRVIIDFADDSGRFWSTVGVSANIVDASFGALLDAVNWKLVRDEGEMDNAAE